MVAGIEKDYYVLEEIEERWGLPWRDIAYLAENGLLKVSVRLYGVCIERGSFEQTDNGQWFSIPEEQTWFQGLLDLRPRDIYRLFHESSIRVQHFAAPDAGYCRILRPAEGLIVQRKELVVRRDERDRVEVKYGLGSAPRSDKSVLCDPDDFSEVSLANLNLTLGPIQAQVVQILREAANTTSPWRHGKQILTEAGSSCTRMSDLFKTQPGWRRLIQSDGRGKYRLNSKFFRSVPSSPKSK